MFKPFKQRSLNVEVAMPPEEDSTDRIIKQYQSDKFLIDLFTKSKDCLYRKSAEFVGRVYLVNPEECASNPDFNATNLSEGFKTIIGKREWEVALAGILVKAIFDWKISNSTFAEVSNLFNRDYYSIDNRKIYTNIDILKRLGKCFEIVEVTEKAVFIRWKV